MFLNNTEKIDSSTDIVAGMVWAEDINILIDNFNAVLLHTGIDDLRKAIEKICKPVLTVLNSNTIESNFQFDISYFIVEEANTNKLFLTISNRFYEVKSCNGYSLPAGFLQPGDAVIVYRSHDGNYYVTSTVKRLPDLLTLVKAKAVLGTTVFILVPNQLDNDQTFTEWVENMYIYCHTPYGVECVCFDGSTDDSSVMKKVRVGNEYHLLSYLKFRVLWYRYETTSSYANGGTEIINKPYEGIPYPPSRNLYLTHEMAKKTNIGTSPYALGCTTYASSSLHPITFQHLDNRTRVLGRFSTEWTLNLATVGQNIVIPEGTGSDIVSKYSTILLENMIPTNGDAGTDIQIGYPTEAYHGVNYLKFSQMGLVDRDMGYASLNGVSRDTLIDTVPIDIDIKPNLPKGDHYTYGIYYGGLAPSLTFANFKTKTEEIAQPNPLIYTCSGLDKGSAGALRIGRKSNSVAVDGSIPSVTLDGTQYVGTNYIKFESSVWSFSGDTLIDYGVVPPELVGMVHGDTCTIGNTSGKLYGSFKLNYKRVFFGSPEISYLGYLVDKDSNTGFVIGTNKANIGGLNNNNPNNFVQKLAFGGAKIIRICDDGPVWFYLTESGALYRKGENNQPVLVTEDKVIWFAVTASPTYDNLVYINDERHVKASLSEITASNMYSRFIDLGVTTTPEYMFDKYCLSAYGVVAFPVMYSVQFKKLYNGENLGGLVTNMSGGAVNQTSHGLCMYDTNVKILKDVRRTLIVDRTQSDMLGTSNAIYIYDAVITVGLIFVSYRELSTYKVSAIGDDTTTKYLTGGWMGSDVASGFPNSTIENRVLFSTGYNCDWVTGSGEIWQRRVRRDTYGWETIQPEGYRIDDFKIRSRTSLALTMNYHSDNVSVMRRGDDVLVASRNIGVRTSPFVADMGTTVIPSGSGFQGIIPKTGKCSGNLYYNHGGKTYMFMPPNTVDNIHGTTNPNIDKGTNMSRNFIGIVPSMINEITISTLSDTYTPTFSFNENAYGNSQQTNVLRCNAGFAWHFADDGTITRLDDIGDADDYYYVNDTTYCYVKDGDVYTKGYNITEFVKREVYDNIKIVLIYHDASCDMFVSFLGADNRIYIVGDYVHGFALGATSEVRRLNFLSYDTSYGPYSNVMNMDNDQDYRFFSTTAEKKASFRVRTSTLFTAAGHNRVAMPYINKHCRSPFPHGNRYMSREIGSITCYDYGPDSIVYSQRDDTTEAVYVTNVAIMYDRHTQNPPMAFGDDTRNNVKDGGMFSFNPYYITLPSGNKIYYIYSMGFSAGAIYRGNVGEYYACGDFPTGAFEGFTKGDYMHQINSIVTTNQLGLENGIYVNQFDKLLINYDQAHGGPRPPVPQGPINSALATNNEIVVVHTNIGVFRLKPGGYEPLSGPTPEVTKDTGDPLPVDTYVFYDDCYDDGFIRRGGLKYNGDFEYTLSRNNMVTIPDSYQYGLNNITYSHNMVACLAGTQLFAYLEYNGVDHMVMFPIASVVYSIAFEDQLANILTVSTEHGVGYIKFDTKEIIDLIVDEEYSKNRLYKLELTVDGMASTAIGFDLTEFTITYDNSKILQ